MSSLPDSWHDTCAQCGRDLPIDAPSHQRYCSPECRELAFEGRDYGRRQQRNVDRKAARLATKADRPCEGCGIIIPATALRNQRFCSDPCQRRHYDKRVAAAKREQRLAAREAMRAQRLEQSN